MRRSICFFLLTAALQLADTASRAQEKQKRVNTLPDDPVKAWAEVKKAKEAMRPPVDWRTRKPTQEEEAAFQKQVCETAASLAGKAQEFITRFPTNENKDESRILVLHALTHAVAAGDKTAEAQMMAFISGVVADKSIPEDDRAMLLGYAGTTHFYKQTGMRLFTEGMSKFNEEHEAAGVDATRAALKQFPTNSMLYTMLVAIAQRAKGERQKELATEIANAPGAPPGAKALAGHILKGTRPYQVGLPLDIRFTALDGREVDLAKLKGKVVMVEFWSTSCGPCIAQLPALKAAYAKFHERGFEVVAIALDEKESVLRRFIKENELPWPQHFDGKGWGNKFAVQFGIFGIPTTWLIDKRGHLQVTHPPLGAPGLEGLISRLLDEPVGLNAK